MNPRSCGLVLSQARWAGLGGPLEPPCQGWAAVVSDEVGGWAAVLGGAFLRPLQAPLRSGCDSAGDEPICAHDSSFVSAMVPALTPPAPA